MSVGRFGTRILRAEEDQKTHHKTKVTVKLIEWVLIDADTLGCE